MKPFEDMMRRSPLWITEAQVLAIPAEIEAEHQRAMREGIASGVVVPFSGPRRVPKPEAR